MSPDDQPELDAVLADAVRRAYVRPVDTGTARRHVAALAAATAATADADLARRRAPRRRRRVWGAVVAAAAGACVLPAGLALAGVPLPDVVSEPYRAIGITLPHQAREAAPATPPSTTGLPGSTMPAPTRPQPARPAERAVPDARPAEAGRDSQARRTRPATERSRLPAARGGSGPARSSPQRGSAAPRRATPSPRSRSGAGRAKTRKPLSSPPARRSQSGRAGARATAPLRGSAPAGRPPARDRHPKIPE